MASEVNIVTTLKDKKLHLERVHSVRIKLEVITACWRVRGSEQRFSAWFAVRACLCFCFASVSTELLNLLPWLICCIGNVRISQMNDTGLFWDLLV